MIVDTNDLNQAFDAYKTGKIMRKDMLRIVCDHLIALEAEAKLFQDGKSVRDAEAQTLSDRLTGIGVRLDNLNNEIDAKVALAANNALSLWRGMNEPVRWDGPTKAPSPRRGRPPKQPQAEAGG